MSGFLSAFPHDHIYYTSYTGVRFAMRETRLTEPVYAGRQFLKKNYRASACWRALSYKLSANRGPLRYTSRMAYEGLNPFSFNV